MSILAPKALLKNLNLKKKSRVFLKSRVQGHVKDWPERKNSVSNPQKPKSPRMLTTYNAQTNSPPKNTVASASSASAKAAVCWKCQKEPHETAFSNKQAKRLAKGQQAICKACSGQPDASAPPQKVSYEAVWSTNICTN